MEELDTSKYDNRSQILHTFSSSIDFPISQVGIVSAASGTIGAFAFFPQDAAYSFALGSVGAIAYVFYLGRLIRGYGEGPGSVTLRVTVAFSILNRKDKE